MQRTKLFHGRTLPATEIEDECVQGMHLDQHMCVLVGRALQRFGLHRWLARQASSGPESVARRALGAANWGSATRSSCVSLALACDG